MCRTPLRLSVDEACKTIEEMEADELETRFQQVEVMCVRACVRMRACQRRTDGGGGGRFNSLEFQVGVGGFFLRGGSAVGFRISGDGRGMRQRSQAFCHSWPPPSALPCPEGQKL